jgi:hypothetical protein
MGCSVTRDVAFAGRFTGRISPDADAARKHNLRWVREYQLVTGPADQQRLRAWDLADLWLPGRR